MNSNGIEFQNTYGLLICHKCFFAYTKNPQWGGVVTVLSLVRQKVVTITNPTGTRDFVFLVTI